MVYLFFSAHGDADTRGRFSSERAEYEFAAIDYLSQVDTCRDAHAVEHIQNVLGGHIAAHALSGVGTTAQASAARVYHSNAVLQRLSNVRQRQTVRVVAMYGQSTHVVIHNRSQRRQQPIGCCWISC